MRSRRPLALSPARARHRRRERVDGRAVEDGQTVDRTPGERPQRFGDRGCLDVGFPSFLLVGARCDVRTVSCSSAHQPYTGRKQPHEPGGQAGHPDEHER